jgi:FkbM family methyltransferase
MLTTLLRLIYKMAPGPIARRLAARTPPFLSKFTVDFPENKSGIIHGLGEANFLRDLFWRNFESSNPEFNRVLFALAKDSEDILDLGSYLGYYTLTAAKANPEARIYSVEPFPLSVDYQKKMISLNGLRRVTVCDVALSDEDGTLPFYVPDYSQSRIPNIGSLVDRFGEGTHYEDRKSIRTEVDALTLDSLCKRYKIESIDLIKFYIEEMETSVFTASKDLLSKHKPDLLGWIFFRDDNVEKLGELLDKIGYKHFVFKGQELVSCPALSDAKELGDVFNPHRGGRSSIFCTTDPDKKIPGLAVQIPGLTENSV